jgi:hypothetical protein
MVPLRLDEATIEMILRVYIREEEEEERDPWATSLI